MEKNQITTAPLLEIIFDGRNKAYGAYELRKKYNRRLTRALGITFGSGIVIFMSSFFISQGNTSVVYKPKVDTLILDNLTPPEEELIVIPPKPIEQQVATVDYTKPVVVPNDQVREDEMPPEINEIEHAVISTVSNPGELDKGIVSPPVEDKGGVVEAPKQDDEDKVFLKVEKEAEFPGGAAAWSKYVSREVNRNIDELQDDGRSGTVMVYFIVDREGNVSEVKVMSCGEAGLSNCLGNDSKLAEIALNAIRKGPKWIPALQNGKNVKAYRRQQVTFQLQEE